MSNKETSQIDRLIGIPAGIASGVTKLIVGHPLDTVKVRMQTEGGHGRFKGPMDCLMTTIRKEGFRALYRGATPPLIGWTIMDSVTLTTLTNMRILIQSRNPDRPLRTIDQCAAGLVAGLTVSFVATPIELLKAKLQVQYNAKASAEGRLYTGPVDLARKLVHNHGITAIYQGLVPCLMFRSFFWALWGSYDIFSNILKKKGYSDTATAFLAGGMSANVFWTISYPCDVIKNRIMAQPDPGKGSKAWKYDGVASCAKHIYKSEGIKGFYRGFAPCFLRSFPMNGAAILVFETVSSTGKRLFKD
ncbi:mitochondrial carrier domain-containing protein [Obelidium mucronatum]|nr:mitochondrial carrier domain-containing protein [Obelidium mucronatum]